MISGIDEAGRGPVIGPLVVAGVKFKDDKILIQNNVRDSKKISPKRRRFLAKGIKETCLDYEVLVIPAADIDDMRKVMTMNEIELHAFIKVIKKLKPSICYVDAPDVNEGRFKRDILSKISSNIEIVSKHKADDIYPIVGAASIIAKTRRDEEIRKISESLEKRIGTALGSGYPADPITQNFLRKWVEKYKKLPPHTRHSWKTAKRVLQEKNIKKLDKF